MAKKRKTEAPPLMNLMGLMYFDEEESSIRLEGRRFAEIMLVISLIALVIAKFLAGF